MSDQPRRGRAEAAREASRLAQKARKSWSPERRAEAAKRQQETKRANEQARKALLRKLSPAGAATQNPTPRLQVKGNQPLTERQRRVYESQRSRGVPEADAMIVARRSAP